MKKTLSIIAVIALALISCSEEEVLVSGTKLILATGDTVTYSHETLFLDDRIEVYFSGDHETTTVNEELVTDTIKEP